MKKTLIVFCLSLLIIGGAVGGIVAWVHASDNHAPGMVKVLAPIDYVEIAIAESFPPQYFLHIVSGLPDSCTSFDSYHLTRDGYTIRVEVFNLVPADGGVACAQVYRTVENTIALGSDFVSGKTYTIGVNNVTKSFVAE